MKIAYILTPIEFGGSERVNLNFLNHVDRYRFDIHLLLLIRPWEEEPHFITELNGSHYVIYKIPVAKRPPSNGKDYFRVLRCLTMVWSILKRGRYDLVHTHGYFADIIGITSARLLGIPVISTCHGFITTNLTLKAYNVLDRIILRFSNKIIAVSEDIKTYLINNNIETSRIDVILNTVERGLDNGVKVHKRRVKRSELGINELDFVVGYVGRLSEEKGVQILLHAMSIVINSGIPAIFVAIGDGPQKSELERFAEAHAITSHIILPGFQTDIVPWLSVMDIFVLPSLMEGTPMSLLEAMAFGIPPVATSVGGIPNIIEPGKNGLLVQPGNVFEISDAIIRLYKDSVLRKRISFGARKITPDDYGISDWSNRIEQVYIRVAKKNVV